MARKSLLARLAFSATSSAWPNLSGILHRQQRFGVALGL